MTFQEREEKKRTARLQRIADLMMTSTPQAMADVFCLLAAASHQDTIDVHKLIVNSGNRRLFAEKLGSLHPQD